MSVLLLYGLKKKAFIEMSFYFFSFEKLDIFLFSSTVDRTYIEIFFYKYFN